MPLFRRRTPPPVNENAAKLATALGAAWAMSGRPKMTDRALIRAYVETFTEVMQRELLDEEHMALTPDLYAGRYEEGLKAARGQSAQRFAVPAVAGAEACCAVECFA